MVQAMTPNKHLALSAFPPPPSPHTLWLPSSWRIFLKPLINPHLQKHRNHGSG